MRGGGGKMGDYGGYFWAILLSLYIDFVIIDDTLFFAGIRCVQRWAKLCIPPLRVRGYRFRAELL